ncbi:hypothetical protein J9303_17520 [Bacillaceae bacterium Marseille-Q3522]|nr:hypothetical protein [Bacillaceae bacterium Marseille-Q3522]
MKTSRSLNSLGYFPFIIIIGLVLYFSYILIKYPLVGIETKTVNNQWFVDTIYEKGWAANQPIEIGDEIILVNGKTPDKHLQIHYFHLVDLAETITIRNQNSETKEFAITYQHLTNQFFYYLILPGIFTIINLLFSIFLYQKKKNDPSAKVLIYFLLSLGICYLSASVSAKGELIGRIVNTVTLPGSLLLLIHFLKSYFSRFHQLFINLRTLVILYIIYGLFLIVELAGIFIIKDTNLSTIDLLYFILLLIILLFLLGRFYWKNRNSDVNAVLKILLFSMLLAFAPFVFLYVVPELIFHTRLLSAESTAVFLIVIPVSFVYLQLSDKLFDINFILGRLRYYGLLSLFFSLIITGFLAVINKTELLSVTNFLSFLLLFACSVLFLFLKEFLDYKMRHHLFSPRGKFQNSLNKYFQKAKEETKVASLITNLKNEIRDVLTIKEVEYLKFSKLPDSADWVVENNDIASPFIANLEMIKWERYHAGALVEMPEGFAIVVGEEANWKSVIVCGVKRSKVKLNMDERIWLETITYFSSIILENFQLIEDLLQKLESYKAEPAQYPNWLSKLLFSISEKERLNLAADLHDSVLQDQIQLMRDVEILKEAKNNQSDKKHLQEIIEKILDNIHLLRETCNDLRPPLLSETGIIQSIKLLFDQTKLRANFLLHQEIDNTISILDQDVELAIYRVIQELFHNAMKHSQATEVWLALKQRDQLLQIQYKDNGVGMDPEKLGNSFQTMGLWGMKERIRNIGGKVDIASSPGKGMNVIIEINCR